MQHTNRKQMFTNLHKYIYICMIKNIYIYKYNLYINIIYICYVHDIFVIFIQIYLHISYFKIYIYIHKACLLYKSVYVLNLQSVYTYSTLLYVQ